LQDHLTRALALAERDRRWTGVLWIGMRRFTRPTEDGRALADEVLRQTAQRLRTAIRESDLAARVENDAFAVTLTAMTTPADARIVAVRVLLTLSSPVFVEGRDRSVRVTAGVVSACDRSIDPETLIVRARRAAVQGVELDEPLVVSAA
jgi:diguanylate cyclase (GGDEF)-like protein